MLLISAPAVCTFFSFAWVPGCREVGGLSLHNQPRARQLLVESISVVWMHGTRGTQLT